MDLSLPLALSALPAKAVVLSQYTFGTNTATTFAATTVDGNFTAGNVTASIGNQTGQVSQFFINIDGNYTSTPVLQVNVNNDSTTAAQAVTIGSFYSFVLTPNVGITYNLSSLTFDAGKEGTGNIRGYVVRSSRDNFASDIQTADVPTVRPTFTTVNVPLTGTPFTDLTDATTFRIYSYSPDNGKSVEYDTITLNGTAVPEPSAALLGALGALCLLRRKR